MKTEYLRNLAAYYLEVLKHVRATTTTYLSDVTQGRFHEYVDLSFILDAEVLLTDRGETLILPPQQRSPEEPPAATYECDIETEDEPLDKVVTFQRLQGLYQKHLLNPYEREFLYGYPFVAGSAKGNKRICSPLFTVPCCVDYDLGSGHLRIRLTSDELQFNSYAWADILGEQGMRFLEKTLLEDGYPGLPLRDEEFQGFLVKLINAVGVGYPGIIESVGEWEWTLEPITGSGKTTETGENLKIMPHAAVLLVSRPQYYVRRDLDELQTLDGELKDSVLSAMFSEDLMTPADTESAATGFIPLPEDYLFPFDSNPAQRMVAEAIESNRLVVVQGPPGTGKSQTICNLVCHLVAQGKTVLVTSQKNKALEVVGDKLSRLNIEYLSMSLLKDDVESKRELAQQLNTLDAHLQGIGLASLERSIRRMEKQLGAIRSENLGLRQEFEDARNLEHENESLYCTYHSSRADDILGDITLPDMNLDSLVEHMLKYVHIYKSGSETLGSTDWLATLNSYAEAWPVLISDTDGARKNIVAVAVKIREIAGLFEDGTVAKLAHGLLSDTSFPVADCAELMRTTKDTREVAVEHARQHELTKRTRQDTVEMLEAAAGLAGFPPDPRERVRQDISQLNACIEKAYEHRDAKWFNIGALSRRRAVRRASGILCRWPEQLNPERLRSITHSSDLVAWEQERAKINQVLDLADLESSLRRALRDQKYPVLSWEDLCGASVDHAAHRFDTAISALSAVDAISDIRDTLPTMTVVASAHKLRGLLGSTDAQAFLGASEDLESLAKTIPYFSSVRALEAALGGQLADWLQDYSKNDRMDDGNALRDRFRCGVSAYRLRKQIERDSEENSEDTAGLAERIRHNRLKAGEICRNLISKKITHRLKVQHSGRSVAREIAAFRKAIRRGKKNFQIFERLKGDIDFAAILKIFPCWIMSIDDVCRVFPREAGLFDVLIVDEASQCHLMGALPLLYRAKSAIVVGDENQLPNADVMFLSKAVNEELKRRFAIASLPKGFAFDPVDSSLLDLAELWREGKVFLNEHFRSLPDIIRWSNARFYHWNLRIMTDGSEVPPDGVFETRRVDEAHEDENKVNRREAETVVEDLIRRMSDSRYDGLSFGILSLYREQAAYIERLLQKRLLDRPALMARKTSEPLIASTVDGFQGDERDVIFYSFRYAPNSHPGVVQAIQKGKSGECRINVAFTRARKKVICYVSRDVDEFPRGNIRDFLMYARNPSALTRDLVKGAVPVPSDFALDVGGRLMDQGLSVQTEYPACGFFIDLVVTDPEGRRIAVECDGQRYHYDEAGELLIEDLERQEILERAGWYVVRVPSRRYWQDPDRCIEDLVHALRNRPTPPAKELEPEREAAPEETPFALEEEAARSVETRVTPVEVAEVADKTEEVSEGPSLIKEGVQVQAEISQDPRVWFTMARWAKEHGYFRPKDRKFVYTVGIYLRNGWDLSDKMKPYALSMWRNSKKLGFGEKQGTTLEF